MPITLPLFCLLAPPVGLQAHAADAPAVSDRAQVRLSTCRLRSTPSRAHAPVATLPRGAWVTLVSAGPEWVAVSVDGQPGYLPRLCVLRDPSLSPEPDAALSQQPRPLEPAPSGAMDVALTLGTGGPTGTLGAQLGVHLTELLAVAAGGGMQANFTSPQPTTTPRFGVGFRLGRARGGQLELGVGGGAIAEQYEDGVAVRGRHDHSFNAYAKVEAMVGEPREPVLWLFAAGMDVAFLRAPCRIRGYDGYRGCDGHETPGRVGAFMSVGIGLGL